MIFQDRKQIPISEKLLQVVSSFCNINSGVRQ